MDKVWLFKGILDKSLNLSKFHIRSSVSPVIFRSSFSHSHLTLEKEKEEDRNKAEMQVGKSLNDIASKRSPALNIRDRQAG